MNPVSADLKKLDHEVNTIKFKGDQFGMRLIKLYSPDMVKAFYVHYSNLSEVEFAVGDSTMALYYQAVSDALYAHINHVLNEAEDVDGGG